MKHVGTHVQMLTGRRSKYGCDDDVVAVHGEQHPFVNEGCTIPPAAGEVSNAEFAHAGVVMQCQSVNSVLSLATRATVDDSSIVDTLRREGGAVPAPVNGWASPLL